MDKHIHARSIEPNDAQLLFDWYNSEEINLETSVKIFPFSLYFLRRSIENGEYYSDKQRFLVFEHDGIPFSIGSITNVDFRNRQAEIGIQIGLREYWGKGYSLEIGVELVRICFDLLGMHRIYLSVNKFNRKSLLFASRYGKKEAVLRDAVYKNGQFWDRVIFSILEDEWRAWKSKHQEKFHLP